MGRDLATGWGERFIVSGKVTEQSWREFVWACLACTSFADWSCGHLLEALDNSPHADSTAVVFWTDNGYHCGKKDHWGKTILWEQASMTPVEMHLSGSVNADKTCARAVRLIDLCPTLADFCRLE